MPVASPGSAWQRGGFWGRRLEARSRRCLARRRPRLREAAVYLETGRRCGPDAAAGTWLTSAIGLKMPGLPGRAPLAVIDDTEHKQEMPALDPVDDAEGRDGPVALGHAGDGPSQREAGLGHPLHRVDYRLGLAGGPVGSAFEVRTIQVFHLKPGVLCQGHQADRGEGPLPDRTIASTSHV